MATGKIMNRSRNQLASAYAPGSFFTFEGGMGACISVPVPTQKRNPERRTRDQIYSRMQEILNAWYGQAMSCRSDDQHSPKPLQCVDEAFLNRELSGVSFDESRFVYLEPKEVGYAPAPLTFVCQKCKLVRTYDSIRKLHKELEDLQDQSKCPHPSRLRKCDWRQLDVLFVHWSGNWEAAKPNQYQWSEKEEKVVERYAECSCGSRDFALVDASPAIGKWYFQCARCRRPLSPQWLQNDQDTLRIIGSAMEAARLGEVRMEPISYRASAVFYVQSDQFIDFRDTEYDRLNLLEPSSGDKLEEFIGEHYGFGATWPEKDQIKELVLASTLGNEWGEFEKADDIVDSMRPLLEKPNTEAMAKAAIELAESLKKRLLNDWVDRGIVKKQVVLPESVRGMIANRNELYPSRYDPFRLSVEHETLLATKIIPNETRGGRRAFVPFDNLDQDLSPAREEEKVAQQTLTRQLLDQLGVETMGLIREFELCRFSFGYSRVNPTPVLRDRHRINMPVRLRAFDLVRIDETLKRPVYVITQANEAVYVRLNQDAVYEWLTRLRCDDMFERGTEESRLIGWGILSNAYPFDRYLEQLPKEPRGYVYLYTYTLLHTYAHAMMRMISEYSGLDLGSLGEYLFPTDLAFVIFRNGTTMDLGNLSALWRNSNIAFLRALLRPKTLQCGSGSLCVQRGGACPDCVLVPETSCLAFNRLLSRSTLRGGGRPVEDTQEEFSVSGFFDVVAEQIGQNK